MSKNNKISKIYQTKTLYRDVNHKKPTGIIKEYYTTQEEAFTKFKKTFCKKNLKRIYLTKFSGYLK